LGPEISGLSSVSQGEIESLQLAIEAHSQIRQALVGARAMLDTLDAMGVRTISSEELRQWNRTGLEKFEQLRMSYLVSQILWRQTMANLLWAVLTTAILLPIALMLDRQYPGKRHKPENEMEPDDSGDSVEPDTEM
jgi:hypothetical protein